MRTRCAFFAAAAFLATLLHAQDRPVVLVIDPIIPAKLDEGQRREIGSSIVDALLTANQVAVLDPAAGAERLSQLNGKESIEELAGIGLELGADFVIHPRITAAALAFNVHMIAIETASAAIASDRNIGGIVAAANIPRAASGLAQTLSRDIVGYLEAKAAEEDGKPSGVSALYVGTALQTLYRGYGGIDWIEALSGAAHLGWEIGAQARIPFKGGFIFISQLDCMGLAGARTGAPGSPEERTLSLLGGSLSAGAGYAWDPGSWILWAAGTAGVSVETWKAVTPGGSMDERLLYGLRAGVTIGMDFKLGEGFILGGALDIPFLWLRDSEDEQVGLTALRPLLALRAGVSF
jgi:hypothetical protein